jgi:hypothetical protein
MHVESGNGEQPRDIKGIWDFAFARLVRDNLCR